MINRRAEKRANREISRGEVKKKESGTLAAF